MSLITLIFWGLIAAAAVTSVVGAVVHVEGIGAKKVEVKFAPLIEQCKKEGVSPDLCATEWIQALVENRKQASTIRDITQGALACSNETGKQETDSKLRQDSKDGRLAKAEIKINELEMDKKLALQYAKTPRPAGETCEQTLTKIDARMRDLANRELRDRSAEAIRDGTSGGNTKGSSDPSMRITK